MYGTLAWLPMPILAVVNASLREMVMRPLLGADWALPLSGFTLIALLAVYCAAVLRKFLPSSAIRTTWLLGAIWAGLTLLFEYLLFAATQAQPMERLLTTLSPSAVAHGNLFVVAVAFLVLAPRLFHRSGA
ncbi:MAG: hypothetical protein ACLFPA_08840 [Dichotomicrobium sp.]